MSSIARTVNRVVAGIEMPSDRASFMEQDGQFGQPEFGLGSTVALGLVLTDELIDDMAVVLVMGG